MKDHGFSLNSDVRMPRGNRYVRRGKAATQKNCSGWGAMSKVKTTVGVLAIVTSTISMVSLIQALAKLGLIPVLEELITYYRTIARSLLGLPVSLLGLRPPQALLDIWALSFVG